MRHDIPGSTPPGVPEAKRMPGSRSRSITAVFSRLVRDEMHPAPPLLLPETGCGAAVELMRRHSASSAVVATAAGRPLGILTEQDVVRRVAFRHDADVPADAVMTTPVHRIHDDDYLFHGIALMHRHGLRHLPVVDRSGIVVGMLHLHDALAGALRGIVDLIETLTHDRSLGGLARVKQAQRDVAEALLDDGVEATAIQALLSHVNSDIHRRTLALVLQGLREDGWGEPPVAFDLIVMGSGGRGESFLFPDQDNGFILADHPEERRDSIDGYFAELGRRFCDQLVEVGFPHCRGGVMARYPLWRNPLSRWLEQVDAWLEQADPETLRYADIFFDFRPVEGDGNLSGRLRHHVARIAARNHTFLRAMQAVQDGHGVALGFFRQFSPDTKESPGGKSLNLKYHGLLPLVEALRLASLRGGVVDTSTAKRIAELHKNGVLSGEERENLDAAFRLLTRLLLRQQLRDFRKGNEVGPFVPVAALSRRERDLLYRSLRAVSAFRARMHSEFTGDVFRSL